MAGIFGIGSRAARLPVEARGSIMAAGAGLFVPADVLVGHQFPAVGAGQFGAHLQSWLRLLCSGDMAA